MNTKEAYLLGFNAGYELAKGSCEPAKNPQVNEVAEKPKRWGFGTRKKRGPGGRVVPYSEEENELILKNLHLKGRELVELFPGRSQGGLWVQRHKLVKQGKINQVDKYAGLANLGQKID